MKLPRSIPLTLWPSISGHFFIRVYANIVLLISSRNSLKLQMNWHKNVIKSNVITLNSYLVQWAYNKLPVIGWNENADKEMKSISQVGEESAVKDDRVAILTGQGIKCWPPAGNVGFVHINCSPPGLRNLPLKTRLQNPISEFFVKFQRVTQPDA